MGVIIAIIASAGCVIRLVGGIVMGLVIVMVGICDIGLRSSVRDVARMYDAIVSGGRRGGGCISRR